MTRKIHQIYISDGKHAPGEYVYNKMNNVKNMYKDYDYVLYDHDMCRDEVKYVGGEKMALLFDRILPYSFKADFARYCILYRYGGYYFDSSICPEFKIETDVPILYRAPIGAADGREAIDNGVMLFDDCNHPFLFDAINSCTRNIAKRDYCDHPLAITGPVMLNRLESYDINFGRSRWISPGQKAAFFNEEMHWLYKPDGTYLHTFDCRGTNSYEDAWFDRKCFSV